MQASMRLVMVYECIDVNIRKITVCKTECFAFYIIVNALKAPTSHG